MTPGRKLGTATARREADAAFDRAVGARVRERRLAMSALMTQERLGDLVGWSFSKVSRIEKGETSLEPAELARLAEVFGCKTSDLVDGIEVGK